ncbi:MAG: DUF4129 domain-containing protein [Nocardioidaceae bacterium]
MVRRTYTIVGVAAAALVAALVAATISTGSFLSGPKPLGGPPDPGPGPASPRRHSPATGTDDPLFPTWLVVTLTVLLSLYALSLLILVLFSRRGLPAEDESEASADEPGLDEPWRSLLSVDLADAAEEQLSALDQGTPRNAIVACWMSLQAATHRAGLVEEPAETSVEFTLRAMRSLGLDASAIAALGGLYREARFSDHEMTEEQRRRAMEAVRVLAGQLSRGVPRSSPVTGG